MNNIEEFVKETALPDFFYLTPFSHKIRGLSATAVVRERLLPRSSLVPTSGYQELSGTHLCLVPAEAPESSLVNSLRVPG